MEKKRQGVRNVERIERVVEMLGGEIVLGRKVRSESQLIELIRLGLHRDSLKSLLAEINIRDKARPSGAPSGPIGSLSGGLAEFCASAESGAFSKRKLSPADSERVCRLARIAAQAEDVFGSMEKASCWLQVPNRALGDVTPISLLDTDLGTRQLENVLGRIEYGVYS